MSASTRRASSRATTTRPRRSPALDALDRTFVDLDSLLGPEPKTAEPDARTVAQLHHLRRLLQQACIDRDLCNVVVEVRIDTLALSLRAPPRDLRRFVEFVEHAAVAARR